MPSMTKHQRVRAALAGADVDRVPLSFWGHDFFREWTPEGLAQAMLERHRRYDWDYMKVNPRATYYAEAWGCRYKPSRDPTRGPDTVDYVLKSPSDLDNVRPVDVHDGPFAEHIQALRLIAEGLVGDAPFVQTVFSPLSVIGRMANGDRDAVRRWMREAPDALHRALAAVTESLAAYAAACLEAGADGIFFPTVEWATYDNATPDEYNHFARPYDLRVLQAAAAGWFNILHVCRQNNMLALLLDYPVHAFNWASSQPGNPSLAEGLAQTDKAVMGGVDQATIAGASPDEVAAEVREALRQTGARRLLLAPGCSISPLTPDANLHAAADAVRTP